MIIHLTKKKIINKDINRINIIIHIILITKMIKVYIVNLIIINTKRNITVIKTIKNITNIKLKEEI